MKRVLGLLLLLGIVGSLIAVVLGWTTFSVASGAVTIVVAGAWAITPVHHDVLVNQRSRGYLLAEVGAITGTVVAGVPAFVLLGRAILEVIFEDVSDLYLATLLAAAFGVTFAGATLGCWVALRQHDLPGAGRTAVLLALLLYSLYAIGWGLVLAVPLPADLEEHGLLWLFAACYPFTPLAARGLALRWPRVPLTTAIR